MNWKRILVVIARLSALAVVVEAGTIWVCWRSIWTPIQRHYLVAYIWCSVPVSTIEVRIIWKTGPHRKRELATDDDVDSEGMVLSRSALDAGWRELSEGPPQPVFAEKFRAALTVLAFDGEDLWDFLLLPEISALVAAMCKSLHPAEIWLFGSRARGTAGPDSDWDLLAVLDNNAAAELSDPVLAWRISRESDVPSTILTTRRDDLEKIWGLPNTLGYDLSREGVRLIVG